MPLRPSIASFLFALSLAVAGVVSADDKKQDKAAPPTAEKLIEKANEAANDGNFKTAASLIEEAVKTDPKHRPAAFLLSVIQQRLASEAGPRDRDALFLKSAANARKVRELGPNLNPREQQLLVFAVYNEACVFAKSGKADQAIASIEEALKTNASLLEPEMLKSDEDLKSIRKDARFLEIVKKAETAAAEHAKREAADTLKKNKPFAFDFSLLDLDGKTVKLADYKGKVVIVDFWGTWCPPCRMEIPHFVELRDQYKDKGFDVVGINYERAPKDRWKELITDFSKEHKITYKCVIGDEKTLDTPGLDLEGYPTTLFLDRTGKVRAKIVGYHNKQKLEALVTALLNEPAPSGSAAQ